MSPIEFRLDPASGVPTYLQLVHQVEHALRLGYLKPGDQLPKVRDVVASLAINPNTVSKAYRELETKGLIVGRPGQGTFILATLSQVALPELTGLRRSLHGWLAKADTAGLDEDGIVALFTSELRDFYERRSGSGTAAARRAAKRRASHERHRGQRPGQALRRHLGAARVHAGDPRRARGRAGRPERRRQEHAVEPGGRPGGAVRGRRHRARRPPPGSPAALDGIAFVAQDTPLYKNLSAADMLHLTRNLNRRFDQAYAEARLAELGIPLKHKAGKLSGGQQAQLALTLALARRPRLLVLDEPVAMLDPIARHDFMATVMTAVADDGVSVVLSSHVLAELERVADYLIVLSRGRVQMAGEVDDLLAGHRMLTGPAAEADDVRRTAGGACPPWRGTGPPAGQGHRGRSGPAGLGGASGRPGRTRSGLPARARRRGAARARPAAGTPNRRRWRNDRADRAAVPVAGGRRQPAAGAVAADGLGHLAAAPHRAERRGRAAGRAGACCCGSPAFSCTTPTPPRPPATRRAQSPAVTWSTTSMALDGFLANGLVLQAVPALIGAFVGAPVLARELETGTFRYAWTQGFGRWRWTLAKLVALAVVVAAAAGALSVLISWYYQPYFATGNQPLCHHVAPLTSPLAPGLFDLRGVTFAAWTLAAFAIGALAGMLIRRVVPAIVATLAAYTGLALAAGGSCASTTWRRWSPATERARFGVDREPAVDDQGRPAGQPVRDRPGPPEAPQLAGKGGVPKSFDTLQYLAQHGYTHVDQLPAGQPVLAVPVDRGRLAARAVGAAHRRDRVAGPTPGGVTSPAGLTRRPRQVHDG